MTFPTLFITPEMVRDLTLIDSNVDEVRISQAIMDAQLLDFEPVIGRDKYSELETAFDEASLTEVDIELLKEAKMFLINAALLYLLDSKAANISAGSINTASSTDSDPIDIKDIHIIKSGIKAKKNAYLLRLQQFVEENIEDYPVIELDGDIADGGNDMDTALYLP